MKRPGIFLIFFLAIILFSSCEYSGTYTPTKKFDYKLQGLWISNDPSVYYGMLEIDYSSIRISGYESNWAYEYFNGNNDRPFKDYLKNLTVKGYSEWFEGSKTEGQIFIENFGEYQEGISYTWWETYDPKTYKYENLLRIKFGNRNEILIKVPNDYFDEDDE